LPSPIREAIERGVAPLVTVRFAASLSASLKLSEINVGVSVTAADTFTPDPSATLEIEL
jgi:hypothetical protein